MAEKSNQFIKTHAISWDQLHRDAKTLALRLLDQGPFEGIIAVTRGGLVPAAVIARELEIRHIDTVCISSYDWKDQGSSNIIKPAASTQNGKGWLIVEDLVDTGGTAKTLRAMLPEAYLVSVYAKPQGRPLVDDCVTEVSQDTWILFPWDAESQFVPPLVKLRDNKEL